MSKNYPSVSSTIRHEDSRDVLGVVLKVCKGSPSGCKLYFWDIDIQMMSKESLLRTIKWWSN